MTWTLAASDDDGAEQSACDEEITVAGLLNRPKMHELAASRKSVPITVTICPPRRGPRLGKTYSDTAGFTKKNSPAEDMTAFLETDTLTGPAPARGTVHEIKDDAR